MCALSLNYAGCLTSSVVPFFSLEQSTPVSAFLVWAQKQRDKGLSPCWCSLGLSESVGVWSGLKNLLWLEITSSILRWFLIRMIIYGILHSRGNRTIHQAGLIKIPDGPSTLVGNAFCA